MLKATKHLLRRSKAAEGESKGSQEMPGEGRPGLEPHRVQAAPEARGGGQPLPDRCVLRFLLASSRRCWSLDFCPQHALCSPFSAPGSPTATPRAAPAGCGTLASSSSGPPALGRTSVASYLKREEVCAQAAPQLQHSVRQASPHCIVWCVPCVHAADQAFTRPALPCRVVAQPAAGACQRRPAGAGQRQGHAAPRGGRGAAAATPARGGRLRMRWIAVATGR